MMVIYLPVMFEFDWTNCFQVKSPETEILTDRQTNRQNYTNFERNLAMMVIYVPVKFELDWTTRFQASLQREILRDFEFQSPETEMLMDK